MIGTPAPRAWDTLVEYAERKGAEVYTVSQHVPSTIDYDEEADAVVLVSQHHTASGEPFAVDRPTFDTVWNQLRDGDTLSRDDEPEYTSLPALLDGQYRASGVMGMLDIVFDEVESDTSPVRVWIER